MNVLFNWLYRPRYYLTHPWKWFRELRINIHNAWRRISRGYCPSDVWEMSEWFLQVFPPMLRDLADKGYAYPGVPPFETPEAWNIWLHNTADVLESLQEENWEKKNEYEEDFHALFGNKNFTWADTDNIKEKYYNRCKELNEERQSLIESVFKEISLYFDMLWD